MGARVGAQTSDHLIAGQDPSLCHRNKHSSFLEVNNLIKIQQTMFKTSSHTGMKHTAGKMFSKILDNFSPRDSLSHLCYLFNV